MCIRDRFFGESVQLKIIKIQHIIISHYYYYYYTDVYKRQVFGGRGKEPGADPGKVGKAVLSNSN